MIITLAEAKTYLKVDTETEDDLLNTQIAAAEMFIINATGKVFDSTNDLAKLFCMMLVQDMYDNRSLMASEKDKMSISANAIITQLKACDMEAT